MALEEVHYPFERSKGNDNLKNPQITSIDNISVSSFSSFFVGLEKKRCLSASTTKVIFGGPI